MAVREVPVPGIFRAQGRRSRGNAKNAVCAYPPFVPLGERGISILGAFDLPRLRFAEKTFETSGFFNGAPPRYVK